MKKSWAAFFMAGALAFGLAGCGANAVDESAAQDDSSVQSESEAAASEETRFADAKDGKPEEHTVEAIQERGTLTVAIVDDNAPYSFMNEDGTLREGLDSAIANTIAQDMDVALELLPGTQDEVLNAVRSGAADVGLGAFSADDKRLDKVQPTNFYAGGTQTLLMCIEDAKSYGTLKAFATKTIACLRGEPKQRDIVIELLPDDCAIKEVRDVDAGIKKLRSGTCAALMLDEFQGIAYADDNPDLALLRVPLTTETHCDAKVMAVMCDNKSLLDFVNTNIIEKYKKTGGLGRLMLSARVKADNRGLLDAVSDGAADSNWS